MLRTRRHFLKTVILGSASAGVAACRERFAAPPHDAAVKTASTSSAAKTAPRRAGPAKKLAGETFEVCHAVRDKQAFPRTTPTEEREVVIIGAGPSGMAAAFRLRDRDILILEKESTLGGNCMLDEWEGVRMSTGGAFYTSSEKKLIAFFKEAGVKGTAVPGNDSLVIDQEPVVDFFRDGVSRLPFPQKVKDDFRRSREDLIKKYKKGPEAELDKISFAELLKPYAPELTNFWDRFGRSNWGADAEGTSGYIGCEAYTWAGGSDDPRWSFPGGLAGGARQLADVLAPKLGDRIVTHASVYRIEREGKGAKERVVVHYLKDGSPKAVRARAVILAFPKFFAKHVVGDLPEARAADIMLTRYEPFLVLNVCLKSPGPEPAYDNWFLDTPFTDFIPADWILYAGKGPPERKSALTVYHPLAENQRVMLLIDDVVLQMVDGVADGLERHFPGTIDKIAEVRLFRRGHAMFAASPGRMTKFPRAAKPLGPILFAHTDSGLFPSFDAGVEAGEAAAKRARAILKA